MNGNIVSLYDFRSRYDEIYGQHISFLTHDFVQTFKTVRVLFIIGMHNPSRNNNISIVIRFLACRAQLTSDLWPTTFDGT